MHDYYYAFKQKGSWKLWADFIRRLEPEITQYGVHVTTLESARYSHLIDMHVKVSLQSKTFFVDNLHMFSLH